MTVAWMCYVLLVGSLLALGALAVDGILRRTTLPTRWVWVMALGGIVALAVLAPRSPGGATGRVADASLAPIITTAADRPASAGLGAALAFARATVRTTVNGALVSASARVPSSVALPLVVSWALTSIVLLIVILIVNRRAHADRHLWPLAEVHGTRVRIAPEIGPAVIGLTRPEIVVPQWLLRRSPEEQQLVVLHEREHVVARDQLLPVGGWIVAALVPWHPAVWWALSRLRLAIELDCDARVITRGVQPRPYGALLIDIAGQCAGHRAGALALADRPSHLERRLLAMKQTRPRFALVRSGTLGALAILSILVACEARLPTSADIEKMDVASVEKAAAEANLFKSNTKTSSVFFVDGREVSAEDAHAILATHIAHIELKKDAAGNAARVNISTTGQGLEDGHGAVTSFMMKAKTKNGEPIEPIAMRLMVPTKAVGSTASPKVIIDGVVSSERALGAIQPGDVMSIEVVKSAAAGNGDPTAGNGIIKITTKHAKQ